MDVAVIGGGLAGLSFAASIVKAKLLSDSACDVTVVLKVFRIGLCLRRKHLSHTYSSLYIQCILS